MKKLSHIFHIDHLIITVLGFLVLKLIGLIALNVDVLNPIVKGFDNFSVTDIFFEIQNSNSEPEDCDLITLVDMTELYQRGDIANMIEEINMNNPLLVGVDLIFEGVKDDNFGNELLEGSVMGITDRAVFSTKLIDYKSDSDVFTNRVSSYFANNIPVTEAYTNLSGGVGGELIKTFSIKQFHNEDELLSFPAKLAAHFDDSIHELTENELLINYRNVNFPVVKWSEIAEKSELIDGHIVLIGTMTEEQDMHLTPLGKMPGLKLQAYSLLTLLEHKNIRTVPMWATMLLAFLICYLFSVTIYLFERFMKNRPDSLTCVFFLESEFLYLIFSCIFAFVIYWIFFYMFTQHSILIDGAVIPAILMLIYELRIIYKALILVLKKKYNWKYFEISLFND